MRLQGRRDNVRGECRLRCTQVQAQRRGTRAPLKPPPGLMDAPWCSGSRTCNASEQLSPVRADQGAERINGAVRYSRESINCKIASLFTAGRESSEDEPRRRPRARARARARRPAAARPPRAPHGVNECLSAT